MLDHPERLAVHAAVDHWFGMDEVESHRGPGWYEAACSLCPWFTSGTEPVVDDAVYDHMHDQHPNKWRPMVRDDG